MVYGSVEVRVRSSENCFFEGVDYGSAQEGDRGQDDEDYEKGLDEFAGRRVALVVQHRVR